MARVALAVAVLLLALPASAAAQFGGPFGLPEEDYGPGISVTGAGFAPNGKLARATARAVGDARRRAEGIAFALGVTLGEVRSAEVRTPFEPLRDCRPDENPRRCASLEAAIAEVTFAIVGGPTSDEGAREVTGSGTATAPVDAARRTSPSIRHGLRAARLAATPDAATAARANAEAVAAATGVTLGQLFSVSEQGNPYGYEPLLGVYGPGRFCVRQRRVRLVRDPETGDRRVVRGPRVLRCFRQRTYNVTLEITYLGA